MNRWLFAIFLLFPLVTATSDFSGFLAGSNEDIKLFYWNTTINSPINSGTCNLSIYFPNNTLAINALMTRHANSQGLYNYTWSIPSYQLGTYSFIANCSDAAADNQTFFGSQIVVQNLQTDVTAQINSTISALPTDLNVTQNNTVNNYVYNYTESLNVTVNNSVYNTTYNIEGTNTTTINNYTSVVDMSSVNAKLDSGFEDIKRMLREILDFLKKSFNFWKLMNPFG